MGDRHENEIEALRLKFDTLRQKFEDSVKIISTCDSYSDAEGAVECLETGLDECIKRLDITNTMISKMCSQ